MTPPTAQEQAGADVPSLSSRDSGHVPYVWQVLAELSPTTRDTRLDLILSLETPRGLSLVDVQFNVIRLGHSKGPIPTYC